MNLTQGPLVLSLSKDRRQSCFDKLSMSGGGK